MILFQRNQKIGFDKLLNFGILLKKESTVLNNIKFDGIQCQRCQKLLGKAYVQFSVNKNNTGKILK